jgi:hypothetical protein
MRGCVFVEKFDSVDDVRRNGAIFGGAPTFTYGKATFGGVSDSLNYPVANASITGSKPWSIVVRFRPRAINGAVQVSCYMGEVVAGQGLLLGLNTVGNPYFQLYGVTAYAFAEIVDLISEYELVFTFPGGTAPIRCYLNGQYRNATAAVTPTIIASNVWVGAASAVPLYPYQGDVSLVTVFNQQLSDEEVAQHYNNSTYAYRNRASIYLPMRNVDHQALQTLDTSGNNRHGVFSATVPTKLVGRYGYDLNGANNYFTSTLNGAFNTSEISFAVEFEPDFASDGGTEHYFYDCTDALRHMAYKTAGNALGIYLGNTSVVTIAVGTFGPYWRRGTRNVLVVSGKSGKTNVWLNEGLIASDAATAWAAINPTTLYVGERWSGINLFDGRITRFASWPPALTMIQAYDLMALWQKTASET